MIRIDPDNPRAVELGAALDTLLDAAALPPDLTVVLGGDGWMLSCVREGGPGQTYLGLNAGHLGFLLNDVKGDLAGAAEAVRAGRYTAWSFPRLQLTAWAPDGASLQAVAVNDVYVERSTGHTMKLRLTIDGVPVVESLATDGLIVETRTNLFALPEFTAGDFEAQDEGSQLLAELCGGERELVVDLCAGAGGKTLALAAQMANRGRVIACDVDDGKLGELKKRARRAGVTTVETLHLADGAWPDALERRRDKVTRVLVDAPCSGVGALRRNPEARWRMRETDIADFARRQHAIASRAATLLAPGGRMVYATCTILADENQAVAEAVARERDLRIVPLAEAWDARAAQVATADGRFLLVDPDRHGTDGFFAAVLERPR